MALDRQAIEKKDFPVALRGYDPEAVDAHLSALADEIADFKRSALRSDTLTSSASEQVRAIVEAAETSATDILRHAENEAREIRAEANSQAQATREHAAEQAREQAGKLSESTSSILQRLDAMETELGALIESVRTAGNRLNANLALLESNLSEVGDAVVPRARFQPEVEPEPVAVEPEPEIAVVEEEEEVLVVVHDQSPASVDGVETTAVYEFADNESRGDADARHDAEGARLIALNMALNGTPREETARYLSENFALADPDGLLNEVYASVEG